MDHFTKRYHPPGTPPGTLTSAHPPEKTAWTMGLIDYTEKSLIEESLVTPEECRPYLDSPSVTWIHFQGDPHAETLSDIGRLFDLHELALEDVSNTGQRPKLETYEGQVFLVMSLPVTRDDAIAVQQVSFFFGEQYVISFCHGSFDPFEPVRKRLRSQSGRFRSRGADYLLYALIDVVVDQGFPRLEDYGERLDQLEQDVLSRPSRGAMHRIHRFKRELMLLRRMLWPQRDVVHRLAHEDSPLIGEETTVYLRDCYDHAVQIMDLVENYRDMSTSLLDVYLSSISYSLNEIMRVLTLIATIFIPLTFIAGVYGMNFGNNTASPWAMPELRWYFGYPLAWLIMLGVAVGMLIYFKRRKWL